MSLARGSVTSEMLMRKQHFKSSVMLWSVFLILVIALLWSANAQIDELVRGDGKVIPSSHLKVVQSLDGGVLAELLVQDGQRVEAGQLLMRLDDTRARSRFNERNQSVKGLEAKIARLKAESSGLDQVEFPDLLRKSSPVMVLEQKAVFDQRRLNLNASQKILSRQITQQKQELAKDRAALSQSKQKLALAEKELGILAPLFQEGVVSEVELIKAQKAVLTMRQEMTDIELRIPQVQSSIEELKDKSHQLELAFRSEAQLELSAVTAELASISQTQDSLGLDVERALIRSPVSGVVKQVMLTTLGGVVKPGMDLVSIVPEEDTLIIETKVRPSDIARLYPGQKAMVKFSAYDFTVYGGLEAELEQISADSLTNEQGDSFYLVRVKTRKSHLGSTENPLPIISGMQAQVDILTGKKTLLAYLLKPILRAKQVALTEQ